MLFSSRLMSVVCIAIIIILSPVTGFGDETKKSPTKVAKAEEEYEYIFKNMAVLFEHLLKLFADRQTGAAFDDLYDSVTDIREKTKRNTEKTQTNEVYGKDHINKGGLFGWNNLNDDDVKQSLYNEADPEEKPVNSENTIDPEDVEEKILLVEQKLEEYNHKKQYESHTNLFS